MHYTTTLLKLNLSTFSTHRGTMFLFLVVTIAFTNTAAKNNRASTQDYVDIIASVYRFYHEGNCVILMSSSDLGLKEVKGDAEMVKLISRQGIAATGVSVELMGDFNNLCSYSRPLNVMFASHPDTHSALVLMNKISSYPRWLMFANNFSISYFEHIFIPYHCEFLLVERLNDETYKINELYRVDEDAPISVSRFGKWSAREGLEGPKLALRKRRKNLKAATIRVSAKKDWPHLTITPDVNNDTILGGFIGEIWRSLEEKNNFTTVLFTPPKETNAFLPNGSWTGVFGMIERKQVDLSLNDFSMSSKRLDVIDNLFPLYTSFQRVFVRSPTAANLNWDNFLAPFATSLWAAILAFILCLGIALFFVERLGQFYGVHDKLAAGDLSEALIFIHGFCCQQGHDVTPRAMSGRIVFIMGGLTSCILMAAYSAALISFLSVQTTVFPVNSFEDLLQHGGYQVGMIGSSGLFFYFRESADPLIKSVYTNLIVADEDKLPKTYEEGQQKICDNKFYAFMTSYETTVGKWDNLPCDISPLPKISLPRLNAMVIGKDNPYKELINYYLVLMRQSGSLQRIHRTYWPTIPSLAVDTSFSGVTLEQMVPIFTICLSGYVLGVLVLIVEVCVHKVCDSRHVEKVKHEEKTFGPSRHFGLEYLN